MEATEGTVRRSLVLTLGVALAAACEPTPAMPKRTVEAPAATEPEVIARQAPTPSEHRIGVRLVDGVGEFYDRKTGERFVPRGANYIRLAWQRDGGSSTFYHSTFNTDAYDPDRAQGFLAELHVLGYNVARVFLNPCCSTGLSDPSGALSTGYIDNILDFLHKAYANGVYVMFATDAAPGGKYQELRDAGWSADFAGTNFDLLLPSGVQANLVFFRDFAQALIDRGAPLEAIFAYGLRNELFFESNLPPLSMTSGVVRSANGNSYDMASPEDKRRMMDEGLVYFIDQARAAILEVDPTALVTVGFFWPQEPNQARIGDPRFIETRPAIWDSQADFIDLHLYPGVELDLQEYVENYKIDGMASKPIVMAEFGAFTSSYSEVEDAALELQELQIGSCGYGFDGWLLWTWDTAEQPELYTGDTGDGMIGRILAPANRPDPCQPATVIEVSFGTPEADGPSVAFGMVSDALGNPIASAAVAYELVPIDGQGVAATYRHEGIVPAGATHATLGFRVNTECGCTGAAEFTLYEGSYTVATQTANRIPNPRFVNGLDGWGYWGEGEASVQTSDGPPGKMVRVVAAQGEVAAINSSEFPVTSGEAYEFAFLARVAPASAGSGYFTLVFLGPAQEVDRIRLPLEAGPAAAGTLTTDENGAFEVPLLDISGMTLRLVIRLSAAGNVLPGFAEFEIPAR